MNNSYNIYQELAKPPLSPPGWIFGPVWTVLYAMMGIACFRVLSKGLGRPEVQRAALAFVLQLALNFLWPYLYFTLGLRGVAAIEILVLWLAIGLCTWLFFRIDALAGWLMVPYLLWVTFATYLNIATWYLNA
ncbi:TspO and MBR related proteins [Tindallia californiensis]|uniref:TspO and MBR related proteins n=1 Tax=Tindallia californiensis TaxID=159292 RepID=A0A1H3QMS1_9FIRM|nr:TspO and MBR related proteins [Tindallia californiensis]